MPAPVSIIVRGDQLYIDVMIRSSPVRLIVGGRAIFIKLAKSHHEAIRGSISCRPRAKRRVRL